MKMMTALQMQMSNTIIHAQKVDTTGCKSTLSKKSLDNLRSIEIILGVGINGKLTVKIAHQKGVVDIM
jgi:hypothetical protein